MTDRELIDALKELIVLAVRVFRALPDPDAKYLAMGRACAFSDQSDPWFGYGGSTIRVRFIPSPKEVSQAERVNEWISWLSRKDGAGCNRLVDWANGTPTWRIAMREHVTTRTIINRLDRSLLSIAKEFGNVKLEIAEVNEEYEYKGHFTDKPTNVIGGETRPEKVWSGVKREFLVNGKRWRNGHDRKARIA